MLFRKFKTNAKKILKEPGSTPNAARDMLSLETWQKNVKTSDSNMNEETVKNEIKKEESTPKAAESEISKDASLENSKTSEINMDEEKHVKTDYTGPVGFHRSEDGSLLCDALSVKQIADSVNYSPFYLMSKNKLK